MRVRTAEAFTLHLDADGTPFGLDFFVAPVPHDGACPKPARARSGSGPAAPSVNANATVTVALRGPAFPPLCVTRSPLFFPPPFRRRRRYPAQILLARVACISDAPRQAFRSSVDHKQY